MPILAANNAEAQASGTAVTASNTGATNATQFDEAVTGVNMTMTFDTANAAHGSNDFKQALTSTATAATYYGWTGAVLGAAMAQVQGAVYFTVHTAIVSSVRWLGFFNGATLLGYLGLTNGLQGPQWRTAADAAQGTAGPALTADTLYRIEFTCNFSGGSATARLYLGDSTTQTGADQTAAFAWGATSFNHLRVGFNTANFSSTAGQYVSTDDVMLTTDALPIGPGPYLLASWPPAGPAGPPLDVVRGAVALG